MGACASIPKQTRQEAADAPRPEPAKEKEEVVQTAEEVKDEKKEEEKAEKQEPAEQQINLLDEGEKKEETGNEEVGVTPVEARKELVEAVKGQSVAAENKEEGKAAGEMPLPMPVEENKALLGCRTGDHHIHVHVHAHA